MQPELMVDVAKRTVRASGSAQGAVVQKRNRIVSLICKHTVKCARKVAVAFNMNGDVMY